MRYKLQSILVASLLIFSLEVLADSKSVTPLTKEDQQLTDELIQLNKKMDPKVKQEVNDFKTKYRELRTQTHQLYKSLSASARANIKEEKKIIKKMSKAAKIQTYKNSIH